MNLCKSWPREVHSTALRIGIQTRQRVSRKRRRIVRHHFRCSMETSGPAFLRPIPVFGRAYPFHNYATLQRLRLVLSPFLYITMSSMSRPYCVPPSPSLTPCDVTSCIFYYRLLALPHFFLSMLPQPLSPPRSTHFSPGSIVYFYSSSNGVYPTVFEAV